MSIIQHALLAFLLRLGLLCYGTYHDQNYVVKYTDIDYHVYTDAAEYVYEGQSPFDRHTYRYTPLLALILTPNIFLHFSFGKVLFIAFDVLTGVLLYKILRNYHIDYTVSKRCAFSWMYNPMCAVICTRGSSDSIATTLVLLCVLFFQEKKWHLLGITYGLAVHFRMYPCIYVFALYSALSDSLETKADTLSTLCQLLIPNRSKIIFVLCSAIGFFVPSFISYYFYGMQYVEEALLYHLVRKDIKHNFSPYFYFMYLSESMPSNVCSILLFVPLFFHLILLLVSTWIFRTPSSLPLCLFIQTFTFVSFNKVCTSQYFLWYLCLLPLNTHALCLKSYQAVAISCVWLCGQGLWLFPAYFLEFQGLNTFLYIWMSSILLFISNIWIIYSVCTASLPADYKR